MTAHSPHVVASRRREELFAELSRSLATARVTLEALERLLAAARENTETAAGARAAELELEHDHRELVRLVDGLGYTVLDSGTTGPLALPWVDVDAGAARTVGALSITRDPALAAAGVRLERLRFTLAAHEPGPASPLEPIPW